MKKIAIACLSLTVSLSALELGYGVGEFGFDFDLSSIMEFDISLDVTLLSLKERRYAIGERLYLFGNIDIYRSKTLDSYASYADKAADFTIYSMSPSTTASSAGVPTPVSFEMRGLDASGGIGYTLLRKERFSLGVQFESGLSMPYIETENMVEDAELFAEILHKTKTTITTYKLIPSVAADYTFSPVFALYGSFAYGYQFGSIDNDYIKGEADCRGSVTYMEIAALFYPLKERDLQIALGYRSGSWSVEKIDVSVAGFGYDFARQFDVGFDSRYYYASVGWRF